MDNCIQLKGGEKRVVLGDGRAECVMLDATKPVFQVALCVLVGKGNWELPLGSEYAMFHESISLLQNGVI